MNKAKCCHIERIRKKQQQHKSEKVFNVDRLCAGKQILLLPKIDALQYTYISFSYKKT